MSYLQAECDGFRARLKGVNTTQARDAAAQERLVMLEATMAALEEENITLAAQVGPIHKLHHP